MDEPRVTQAQAVIVAALNAARKAFDAVLEEHRDLVRLPDGAEIELTIHAPDADRRALQAPRAATEVRYMPMACPVCGRARLEYWPETHRLKCEKCDAENNALADAQDALLARPDPKAPRAEATDGALGKAVELLTGWLERWDQENSPSDKMAAIRLVLSALTQAQADLAAARKERDALRLNARGTCHVCWTSSYEPCEATDEGAGEVVDQPGTYTRCTMCLLTEALKQQDAALARDREALSHALGVTEGLAAALRAALNPPPTAGGALRE